MNLFGVIEHHQAQDYHGAFHWIESNKHGIVFTNKAKAEAYINATLARRGSDSNTQVLTMEFNGKGGEEYPILEVFEYDVDVEVEVELDDID